MKSYGPSDVALAGAAASSVVLYCRSAVAVPASEGARGGGAADGQRQNGPGDLR